MPSTRLEWSPTMTRDEFMKHAADAAYLGDTSALRGYVGEVFDELERLREDVELHRDAGGYIEDASGDRWWSAGLLSMKEAEIEMLRGVGCREAKEGEPESGPCGVCLKCVEERGAEHWRNAHHEACVRLQEHDCGEEHARMMGYFVELQKRVEAAGELISQVGCDCPCDHDAESHDEECERCLQCLLCDILWPSVSK